MPHKLRAQNIAKKYGSRWVVKDVTLEVNSGEIVGLLGPNGAGKTTAFYMTVGLIKPNKGKVFLDETDITKDPIHIRAKHGIGYLPQEASVFQKLTVEDNILAILETQKNLTKTQRESKLNELLEEFHIEHIRNSKGISLSGGERRRTEIARALATSPRFILLDEPFAGVDPISVIDIKRIIMQLKSKDIGILITDHNVRETLDICEHAYIANDGLIIAAGTPAEVLQNEQVKKVYLGDQFTL